MPQQEKSSRTSWTKTTKRLATNIVNGFPDRVFTCPVFGTRHKIPKNPSTSGKRSVFFIRYRGATYFLERFFKHEDKMHFYRFGLVENLGDVTVFRDIIDISDDTTIKYLYNTSGMPCAVHKIEI